MGRGVRIPIRWDAPALLDAATAEPAHDSTTYTTGECEAVRWGAIAEAAALADTESLEYQAYLSAVRNANDSLRDPDLVAMGGWCGIALTTYFSALNDLRSEAAPS